ncbi:TPA: DUF551 domain-containing protein [Klebsiella pneumoniae]
MTKSTITRERLVKIKSWREIYGAGSNVMLPAEEAEELASMALAAMDSEPLAFTEKHEISNMHATGLYLRAWPTDRARNAVEGYTIPLYTTPQPISLVNSEPVAYIFKHPAGRLFWALTDESNKGHDDVMPVYAAPQPAPVVPDSYVMVPMRLTAENGAKGALSGEFSETKFVNCPECFGDDECETCDGSGRIEITVPVTWTTIKEIWAKGVEHFAAAPQLPGSEPATVPGKWIPLSEQMPPSRHEVLVGRWWGEKPRWCCKWATYIPGHPDAQSSGWLIPGASWTPTHWMPLPAAPQEVNHG